MLRCRRAAGPALRRAFACGGHPLPPPVTPPPLQPPDRALEAVPAVRHQPDSGAIERSTWQTRSIPPASLANWGAGMASSATWHRGSWLDPSTAHANDLGQPAGNFSRSFSLWGSSRTLNPNPTLPSSDQTLGSSQNPGNPETLANPSQGASAAADASSGPGPGTAAADVDSGTGGAAWPSLDADTAASAGEGASLAADGGSVLADSASLAAEGGSALAEAASGVSEIAAATAEVWLPTAALQHCIYAVHTFTGWPWWVSIAACTVAVRLLLLPLMVYQTKTAAKHQEVAPQFAKLQQRLKAYNYAPEEVARYQQTVKELMKKHDVNPLAPVLGALTQASAFIFFYFAILGLANHVPSMATGGALWFTDLSAPDQFYVLPLVGAAGMLAAVELGSLEGMDMQQQENMKNMKMFMRGMAFVSVPVTATFPQAVFCYMIPQNILSIGQGLLLKNKKVRAILGIPAIKPTTSPGSLPLPTSLPSQGSPSILEAGFAGKASSRRQQPKMEQPKLDQETNNQSSHQPPKRAFESSRQIPGNKSSRRRGYHSHAGFGYQDSKS